MQTLFEDFYRRLSRTKMQFVRYLHGQIDWNQRLIGITGARGVGKTTMLLQHVKTVFGSSPNAALYASLDNLWFSGNRLLDLAADFDRQGGKALFIDEVHKYATWSQEIKNIHDGFPNLQLVFTGSSLLELHKGKADLSRRARMYDMRGLSFREFLEYDQGTQFPALALSSILDNSSKLSMEIVERIKPIPAFQDYLRHGYYPFYKEDVRGFHSRLANVANLILESDLPAVESIKVHTIPKIKKLLWLISKSVPFTPNISALSQQVGVSRNSLLNYLSWLERAGLVRLLPLKGGGFNVLAKPEKIYLDNTNFIHAFEPQQPNLGNERETFFFNQVSSVAKVTAAKRGDFLLDDAITVEVGGRNKTPSQLPDASSSYLALDNIEYGSGNRIPLWLFGFLY